MRFQAINGKKGALAYLKIRNYRVYGGTDFRNGETQRPAGWIARCAAAGDRTSPANADFWADFNQALLRLSPLA